MYEEICMVEKKSHNIFLNLLFFLSCLYVFFVSIELMSGAFKLFGKDFAKSLMVTTANPVVGLFIGVVATSLVQSSSSVTSILVGMVAGGTLSIGNAIPMVMGANIGTTVTNTIVSMGHIGRQNEFERALAGATVHDFFNLLCVAIFLPLEQMTHFIEKIAVYFANLFNDAGGFTFVSPLKAIVKPAAHVIIDFMKSAISSPTWLSAVSMLIIALVLLFIALKFMVDLMKKLISGRVENLLHHYLFKSPMRSLVLGLTLTAVIQSSSATTSLIVPIVGAGILTVDEIFPYVLGTNIGTTITAILASLVTRSPAALTVAFAHLTFNISGTVAFYPLRRIPISIANSYAGFLAKHRVLAPIFLVIIFFIIPLIVIFVMRGGF